MFLFGHLNGAHCSSSEERDPKIVCDFSFSRDGPREAFLAPLTTGIKTMKATDVIHYPDVAKSALAAENPILGTWKLQSLVYEVSATGQRSSPFGDHPDGYLSYSGDGRMYAIGVVEDRPKPRALVPTDEEKVETPREHVRLCRNVYRRRGDGSPSRRYFLEPVLDRNGPSSVL